MRAALAEGRHLLTLHKPEKTPGDSWQEPACPKSRYYWCLCDACNPTHSLLLHLRVLTGKVNNCLQVESLLEGR